MKSRLQIIERGKFIEGVVFTLLLVFLLNWFFGRDEPVFRLSLKGFTSEVSELEVSFSESKLLIISPVFEHVGTSHRVVGFIVPKHEGFFDLTVRTEDGKVFKLNDIPFKAGEYNYVSNFNDHISFSKGHW